MHGPLLDALDEEVARLVGIVTGADPSAAVPSCPGWSVERLADHLARVQRWVTALLDAGGSAIDTAALPRRPADQPAGAWLADAASALVERLRATPPDAQVWTFSVLGDRTAAWWLRRQAVEAALHRVDVALAVGAPIDPVAVAVATAGIEELLTDLAVEAVVDGVAVGGFGGTLHLHATDTECEWLVDCSTTPLSAVRGHAKGDAAVRGPVSSLLLWAHNRIAPDAGELEVFGSAALVGAWGARVRL